MYLIILGRFFQTYKRLAFKNVGKVVIRNILQCCQQILTKKYPQEIFSGTAAKRGLQTCICELVHRLFFVVMHLSNSTLVCLCFIESGPFDFMCRKFVCKMNAL